MEKISERDFFGQSRVTEFKFFYKTSDLYTIPTFLSIYSLLKYYKGNEVSILIIHNNLKIENQLKLKSLEEVWKSKLKVNIDFFNINSLEIDKSILQNQIKYSAGLGSTKNVTIETFFNLWTPYMTSANKGLHLDSDTIVVDDISELVNFPLDDNTYIAACKHLFDRSSTYLNWLNGRPNTYINAGVILWNLESIRNHDISQKLIDAVSSIPCAVVDQDIFNIVCYGHIKYLPIEYNLGEYVRRLKYPNNVFTEEDMKARDDHPKIFHYSSRIKPWIYGTDDKTPFGDILREVMQNNLISSGEYSVFAESLPDV